MHALPLLGTDNPKSKNDVVTPVFLLGSQLVVLMTLLRIILPPSQKNFKVNADVSLPWPRKQSDDHGKRSSSSTVMRWHHKVGLCILHFVLHRPIGLNFSSSHNNNASQSLLSRHQNCSPTSTPSRHSFDAIVATIGFVKSQSIAKRRRSTCSSHFTP